VVSEALRKLLITSRSNYNWPEGVGAADSQRRIIELEAFTAGVVAALDPNGAQSIVEKVSNWAGNNADAHEAIRTAPPDVRMMASIRRVLDGSTLSAGLDGMSELPGLGLVIATKVDSAVLP
jgi:hypothetical protein